MSKNRFYMVFFLSIATAFLLSACEKERYPVAGKEVFQNVNVYESQPEVLLHWLQNGYQGMTVINFDYHDDLTYIPDEKIGMLSDLVSRSEWEGIRSRIDVGVKSLYSDSDFLYAAFKLGIIKRLYWVTSSKLLDVPDDEKGIQMFLKAFGYSDEVINGFTREGSSFVGNISGLEVIISSLPGLPKIKEPVLFTVDPDYFTTRLLRERTGELQLLTDFFIILSYKDLKVKHLSLSRSAPEAFNDILYSHVTDELQYLFQNPDTPQTGAFPGLWRLRASGLELLAEGQYKIAMQTFDDALSTFPDEPSLYAGKVVALALLGQDEEALTTQERLTELSAEYEHLYLHIARRLASAGETARAERYAKAYLSIHPDSIVGLMEYAAILYNSERDEEALAVYQRVLEYGDHAEATMFAGDALMHLGRFDEAIEYYRRGVRLVNEAGNLSMRNFPEASRNIGILRSQGTGSH